MNIEDLLKKLGMSNQPERPIELKGNWTLGYALDLHTVSSKPAEVDESGNVLKWDTTHTELGEELNKLKYWKEKTRVEKIAAEAAKLVDEYKEKWQLDVIIPIPPSDMTRPFQPVYELANAIGKKCNLVVDFSFLKKIKPTSELKGIDDAEKRREILKDAFDVEPNSLAGKDVLLFDDLFRSGETLQAATDVLLKKGKARNVFVLTITKTRSKR
jgi:competence protein ComFC